MKGSRHTKTIRFGTATSCLIAAVIAWSHSGPHPPKPVQAPAISPGSVAKGDPVPNRFETDSGLSTGGIGYAWTVSSIGNLTAPLSGIVGASSWRDLNATSPEEGTTRASSWVALRLRVPSSVTIRLARAGNVPDPLGLLPGDFGASELRPAFTLYSGWQESGADDAHYPNQGNIPWAPALTYLDHFEDGGDGVVTSTVSLPAGDYSLAFGGIGEPGFDAGRQGYLAALTILSRAVPASIFTKGKRFKTSKRKLRLKGRFLNAESAAFLAIQQNKKTSFLAARGSDWIANLTGLKPGVNYLYLTAISHDGSVSPRKKITIIRQ